MKVEKTFILHCRAAAYLRKSRDSARRVGCKIEREKAQNIHDALRFVKDNISYFS